MNGACTSATCPTKSGVSCPIARNSSRTVEVDGTGTSAGTILGRPGTLRISQSVEGARTGPLMGLVRIPARALGVVCARGCPYAHC